MTSPSPHSNTESVEQILADLIKETASITIQVSNGVAIPEQIERPGNEASERLFNLMESVIGKDDVVAVLPISNHEQNNLRAEQRARLRKVFNKEKV